MSQAVSALSILLLTPRLVESLGTSQFSQYGVLLNMILFSAVFDLGLNIGLLRKLIHNHEHNLALINTIFFFFLGTLLVLIPLFVVLFSTRTVEINNNIYLLSAFVSILVVQNFLALFFDNIIQRANKIYIGKLIRIGRTTIEFLALWWVAESGSFLYLLITTIFINLLYLAGLFLYAKKEFHFYISATSFSVVLLLGHIRYSFWYFQNSLASALVFNAQVILIGSLAPAKQVTHYLLITRFYEVIRTGLSNFVVILFPSLSKMQADQNWPELLNLYNKMLLRFFLLGILIFVFMVSVGQSAFSWWSGIVEPITLTAFNGYAILLVLLLVENIPNVFLAALKNNKWPSIVSTVQGLLGLGFTYWLLPQYGLVGAILSLIIAFLLTNGWFNFVYMRHIFKQHIN